MHRAPAPHTSSPTPPAAPCRLCLIRHGETAWNTEHRLQGHIDTPLNERGLSQAAATAAQLAGMRFTTLYCSDLRRARETAAAIATAHTLPPRLEPRLRERHYGLFQGLTYAEAEQQHPELYHRFKSRDLHFDFPDGGESLHGFSSRVQAALEDIARQHAGEQVVVVTHGGVLDIAHRLAAGKSLTSPRDFPIPNAALNWIEHHDARWRLLAWADEAHLANALDELPNG